MANDFTQAVIVIPIRDGKIPLAERMPGTRMAGMFVTPGGSINLEGETEEGEEVDTSIPAAALREYEEETGATAEESELTYLGHLVSRGADLWPIGGHFFLLRVKPGVELVTPETEKDKQGPWKWYSFREAAKLPLPPVSLSLIHLLAHTAGTE